MALGTKRVYIDTSKLSAAKIPTGHGVQTAAASLGTEDITESYSWSLTASDSVGATSVIGFDDLLNTELVADIDAFIAASTGLGINTTANTVDYNARVTKIVYGATPGTDMYKTSTLVSFVVSFELKVYIAAV